MSKPKEFKVYLNENEEDEIAIDQMDSDIFVIMVKKQAYDDLLKQAEKLEEALRLSVKAYGEGNFRDNMEAKDALKDWEAFRSAK